MKRAVLLQNRPGPGASADDRDTLVQAAVVRKALRTLGLDTASVPFTLNLPETASALRGAAPDVVFNLVEGGEGGGRCIHYAPALLEDMGLTFTGAGSSAMALSSNKLFAKAVLRAAGIPTPDWHALPGLGAPRAEATGRYIVKSVWEHASIGLGDDAAPQVDCAGELCALLRARAPRMGGECFAERYVEGREFNVALLDGPDGPQVLPVAEMVFDGHWAEGTRVLGYAAKWEEGSQAYRATRRSFDFDQDGSRGGAPLAEALARAALACWHAFGLCGYARVDFRVGADGVPMVIDVNANPCLSPDGGFRAALRRAGLGFEEAVMRILQAGLSRPGFPLSRKAV